MTDFFDALRILILIISVVSGNIIYLVIYNILAEKRYNLSGFRFHINNLLDFSDLIHKTTNPRKKRQYKFLIRGFILSVLLLLGTSLSYITNIINNNDCREYRRYLKSEFKGQVVDKFVDIKNHNSPALKIVDDQDTSINFDLISVRMSIYDSIKIGDELKKLRGDSGLYILRGQSEIKFLKTKKDFCGN